tara:strand:- start:678 stop:1139 length:462 start_codon:yes stop_codon:yes gene_type:complete
MANTIVTIEIGTLMHAALSAVVPSNSYVYARGLKTDAEGLIDPTVNKLDRKCPMVDIIPTERHPQQYESNLRAYPLMVRAITYAPDDPFQIDLYTLSNSVGEWICSSPNIGLTLAQFDAMYVDGPPEPGNAGENDSLQYMQWDLIIYTRKISV